MNKTEVAHHLKTLGNDQEYLMDSIMEYFVYPHGGAFSPTISGTIEESGKDTVIRIKMRPHFFAIMVLIIWTTGFGYWSFEAFKAVWKEERFGPYPFIPIGLILGFYIMAMMYFNFETSKVERKLKLRLKAEKVRTI